GYRRMHGDWILGGYGFTDYLYSTNDSGYWQATLGLEALSENWDLRVNGYLPQASKHIVGGGSSSSLSVDGGGNIGITTMSGGGRAERALPGFDAEAGYRLPLSAADLRIFGGMYHFEA